MSSTLDAALTALGDHEGGKMFMGKPDRWWADPHWRCPNDHVSTFFLKSEEEGAVCLAGGCGAALYLTFPEDHDGPLNPKGSHEQVSAEVL